MSYFFLMHHVTAKGSQTKKGHLKAPSERRRNQHAKLEATFRNWLPICFHQLS